MTYIINYKEKGQAWSQTSYTCQEPVSDQYLIDFFGLTECEDYKIELKKDNYEEN